MPPVVGGRHRLGPLITAGPGQRRRQWDRDTQPEPPHHHHHVQGRTLDRGRPDTGTMQPSSALLVLLLLPLASPAPRQPPETLADFVGDLLAAPLAADIPAPHDPPFAPAGNRPPRDSPEPPSRSPAWARFFADFMSAQRKFRGRTKKAPVAQGCFGMKLDRIGALSGLGC